MRYLQAPAPTNGRRRCLLSTTADCNDASYGATNSCTIPNLMAYWKFEEGSGTTVADQSGNGNTGTLSSSLGWITGYSGSGFNFNSYSMTAPDSGTLTISFELKNMTSGAGVSVNTNPIGKGSFSSGNMEYDLELEPGSYIAAYGGSTSGWGFVGETSVNSGSSNTYWLLANTATYQYGSFHRVTLTRSGSTGKAYEDGTLLYSTTFTPGTYTDGTGSFHINAFNFGAAAVIDEMRIYNRALSQAEIQALTS